MDTLLSLKVFRQVVESGSFTRAADKLGISTAMASKHVSHLENSIQAKLLHRNSRNLHLTEAGEQYYRESAYALDTLQQAAEKAALGTDRPQGQLRITVPIWFANRLFADWVAEYCTRYPDVRPDLSLDNKHTNLVADGFDLALRVAHTPAPTLIVKPLGKIRICLTATPEYLARHGRIGSMEDAARHLAVLPTYVNLNDTEFLHTDGHSEILHLNARIRSNNTLMIYQLVSAHAGIGYLPYWLVKDDIDAGRLNILLPDYRIPAPTLYAAYVERAFLSAKVRTFIDFLHEKTGSLAA